MDFRRNHRHCSPSQQLCVIHGDIHGNYHFPRPETRVQHLQQLHLQKGPAEAGLSAPVEEVWSASGAEFTVLHVVNEFVLCTSSYHETGQVQTAAISRITNHCPSHLLYTNQETGQRITTEPSHPGHTLSQLLPPASQHYAPKPGTGTVSFCSQSPS